MIPVTSVKKYIGGIAALNIPFDCPDSGDWHRHAAFFLVKKPSLFLCGEGEPFNTNDIFGDYGVTECGNELTKIGVNFEGNTAYAANYMRAVIDLVVSASVSKSPMNSVIANDYLSDPESLREVVSILKRSLVNFNDQQAKKVTQWIERTELAIKP